MIIDSKVCSLRFDLQEILKEDVLVGPSTNQVISTPKNEVDFFQVFHCEGLLLCVARGRSRLLVCNPYLGHIKWIQPIKKEPHTIVHYAFGYDNNNRNHKIMRYFYGDEYDGIDVYDFSSESWRGLDVYPEENDILLLSRGVSVKGNTYFFVQIDGEDEVINKDYLLCFDFTTEQFGPRLPLPFLISEAWITSTLCWVRDEKLAVLYNHGYDFETIQIWITTKIDPNAISWNTFFKVDLSFINGLLNHFTTYFTATSFLITEEKKVVVFLERCGYNTTDPLNHQVVAYIFGEGGYFKFVNMGEDLNRFEHGELVCSSYVPSLVQLQINQLGKRKERDD